MKTKPTVSILIPAYNEANTIVQTLQTVHSYISTIDEYDVSIVVVDDGSTDDTSTLAKQVTKVTLFRYDQNKGKGHALRYGMEQVDSDFVYLCDADLSVSIDQLPIFLSHKKQADCVIGSRQVPTSEVAVTWYRKLLGIFGNKLINFFLQLNIRDTQCGFKLLNRDAQRIFKEHTTDGWGFDFDFLLRMKQENKTITEIPVVWVAGEESKMTVSGYIRTIKELILVWWKVKK